MSSLLKRWMFFVLFLLVLASPSIAQSADRLMPGQTLSAGSSLYSSSGNYRLTNQTDGNLVLYDASSRAIWHTRTGGRDGGRLVMQSDGNLVLYAPNNAARWHSQTGGNRGSGIFAVVQNDGNFVLYTAQSVPVWSSRNGRVGDGGSAPPVQDPPTPPQRADRLIRGQTLSAGNSLYSRDGNYRLTNQNDGNLVLYDASSRAIWHTRTGGRDGGRLTMQSDGNLVLYSRTNSLRWHSQTQGNSGKGVFAVVQNDGNFVLYTSQSVPLWSSRGGRVGGDGGNPTSHRVDRTQFFNGVRAQFGGLNQSQVNGINFLLLKMEADRLPAINNRSVWTRQIAYMFATIQHEVASTYQPITEFSDTHCVNYDGGCRYKGRGYVQLTHRYNYEKLSPVVGVDLVASPERALEPELSYRVTSYGMFNGSFTERRLGSYIREGLTDYRNARRVVNGLDRADLIAGRASTFQSILESAVR